VVAELGVFDDGDGAEELEGGLPEVIGVLVAVERRLGVLSAAVELCQGQRQTPHQFFTE
jgi:hypothetical protein